MVIDQCTELKTLFSAHSLCVRASAWPIIRNFSANSVNQIGEAVPNAWLMYSSSTSTTWYDPPSFLWMFSLLLKDLISDFNLKFFSEGFSESEWLFIVQKLNNSPSFALGCNENVNKRYRKCQNHKPQTAPDTKRKRNIISLIWSPLQLTSKRWTISQQFTARAYLLLNFNTARLSCNILFGIWSDSNIDGRVRLLFVSARAYLSNGENLRFILQQFSGRKSAVLFGAIVASFMSSTFPEKRQ